MFKPVPFLVELRILQPERAAHVDHSVPFAEQLRNQPHRKLMLGGEHNGAGRKRAKPFQSERLRPRLLVGLRGKASGSLHFGMSGEQPVDFLARVTGHADDSHTV